MCIYAVRTHPSLGLTSSGLDSTPAVALDLLACAFDGRSVLIELWLFAGRVVCVLTCLTLLYFVPDPD